MITILQRFYMNIHFYFFTLQKITKQKHRQPSRKRQRSSKRKSPSLKQKRQRKPKQRYRKKRKRKQIRRRQNHDSRKRNLSRFRYSGGGNMRYAVMKMRGSGMTEIGCGYVRGAMSMFRHLGPWITEKEAVYRRCKRTGH